MTRKGNSSGGPDPSARPHRRRCYYYAGGERVDLEPADDLFAVGGGTASVAAAIPEAASAAGQPLTGGIRLLTREELGDAAAAGAGSDPEFPVFRSHGAIMVALPEVRVEESRKAHRARLRKWLADHSRDVAVVGGNGGDRDDGDERWVLRPVSGKGADALALANQLAEQVGPQVAQPRFIRVVPRPDAANRVGP
jgi:hypothetical protein